MELPVSFVSESQMMVRFHPEIRKLFLKCVNVNLNKGVVTWLQYLKLY